MQLNVGPYGAFQEFSTVFVHSVAPASSYVSSCASSPNTSHNTATNLASPPLSRQCLSWNMCMTMQAAVFLQDERTEHSVAERIARLCAQHVSNSLGGCTSEEAKVENVPAAPSVSEETPTNTSRMDTAPGSSPVDCTAVHNAWMTECILCDLTVGTDRRPKPPEGVISRLIQSPEPQLSGEVSRRLYELDYSTSAANTALQLLPAPLSRLAPAELRTVLRYFPLHACTSLPAPLAFLSFESKLMTGMHARSADASSACARRYNSLELSDVELQRASLAFLLRYTPLLPPLTSLTISHNTQALVGPFPRRWKRCNRDPQLPSLRESLALWLTLRATVRAVAPTLTHLSLANLIVCRSVLHELCANLKSLVSLDLSSVHLSAPSGMYYSQHERADDVNRCLLRLPQLKRLSLNSWPACVSIPLQLLHMTRLSVLDLCDREYQWGGPNGAVNLHSRLMAQLSELRTLVSLNLSGNTICCKPSRHVAHEYVHESEVCRALFAGLAKLAALRHLGLARSRVLHGLLKNGEGVHCPLSRMTSLTSLDISDSCDAAVEGGELCDGQWQCFATVLGKMMGLKELNVSRAGLQLHTTVDLLRCLSGLPDLEQLILEGNDLSVGEKHKMRAAGLLCCMLRSVQCMPRLRVLSFSSCNISMETLQSQDVAHESSQLNRGSAVVGAMHCNGRHLKPVMQLLNIPVSNDTVSKLATLVREAGHMPCIQLLDLSGNGLTESEVVDALNWCFVGIAPGPAGSLLSIPGAMKRVGEESCAETEDVRQIMIHTEQEGDEAEAASWIARVTKYVLMKICAAWLVIWCAFARWYRCRVQ